MSSAMVLDTKLKKIFYDMIENLITNNDEYECLRVPVSENSESENYRLAIPTTDEEHNEKTILIEVSVPRKKRDTKEDFDAYSEHDRYNENVEIQRKKKEARKEAEERKEKERIAKKNAKKVPSKKSTSIPEEAT